jgi:hypothetical protein
MQNKISGIGRKRPQLNIDVNNLHLDPLNPRLPEDIQGEKEEEICRALYRFFDIEELAFSMAENGYFDEEPLVAIPLNLPAKFEGLDYILLSESKEYEDFIKDSDTQFVVVEGNRRLSTIKLLLSDELRNKFKIRSFPVISDEVKDDITVLPVIIYPNRTEVLPYLGVRHISGIKKWEPYAKARYVAKMVENGLTIDDIQKQVGDRNNSARKIYLCYQLIEVAKYEFDLDTNKAENFFSYLMLASGQGSIKDYLGIEKRLQDINLNKPIPDEKLQHLKNIFSWLFGEGKERLPVIKESRDITEKLSPVLKNPIATQFLLDTRDLSEAYERSDGEEDLLKKYLVKANSLLSKSLGFINRSNLESINDDILRLQETIENINTLIKSKS